MRADDRKLRVWTIVALLAALGVVALFLLLPPLALQPEIVYRAF